LTHASKTMVDEAAAFIASKSSIRPEIGLILGSGLDVMGDRMENAVRLLGRSRAGS